MCHYITLVAATEDAGAVRRIMDRHGRAADPVDNRSIAKAMRSGERQFLTTPGHCDCGTVLAPRGVDPQKALEREVTRLARKGWSKGKIERALEHRRRASERPAGGGGDSAELWAQIIRDLHAELGLDHVGLLVHLYSGRVDDEAFDAARQDAPADRPLVQAVAPLAPDTLTIFAARA